MTRRTTVFSLAAAVCLAATVPASPATEAAKKDVWEKPLEAVFDFYIGGLPIAEIAFAGVLTPDGYDAKSSVLTRGLLEMLVKGRVRALAEGKRHDRGYLTPLAYATVYSTRGSQRAVNMSYVNEVPVKVSVRPEEPPRPYDTKAIEHGGSLDPLTALMMMMTPDSEDNLCNRTIPIFDGKRRYDVILLPLDRRPEGRQPPAPDWEIPMVQCFGVYERIAGFEPDLQKNQRYFPFDIWFENDGDQIFRPLRVAGKTRLGFAIGNLRK